jgi:hypothetical protein
MSGDHDFAALRSRLRALVHQRNASRRAAMPFVAPLQRAVEENSALLRQNAVLAERILAAMLRLEHGLLTGGIGVADMAPGPASARARLAGRAPDFVAGISNDA